MLVLIRDIFRNHSFSQRIKPLLILVTILEIQELARLERKLQGSKHSLIFFIDTHPLGANKKLFRKIYKIYWVKWLKLNNFFFNIFGLNETSFHLLSVNSRLNSFALSVGVKKNMLDTSVPSQKKKEVPPPTVYWTYACLFHSSANQIYVYLSLII